MHTDPEKKIEEWKEHLQYLWDVSVHLAHLDEVFWQTQAIFEHSKHLHVGEPVFQGWMGECYARTLSIALRALIDRDRRNRSFKVLISDMIKHCEHVLTRERHVALYSSTRYLANQNFDDIAGEGAKFVPKEILEKWLADLESLCEPIKKFCNENIAHFSANSSETSLSYRDLRVALRGVQKILTDCEFLLKASVLMRMAPAIQGHWTEPFRTAWLSRDEELPPFNRLEDVELPHIGIETDDA